MKSARVYLHGMPRTPGNQLDVKVLRIDGDTVTVATKYSDFNEAGEATYSIFWRFEEVTT